MPKLSTPTVTEWNNPGAFASRHFIVAPLAHNRLFVVATGVIVINFREDSPNNWTWDRLRVGLSPDVIGEARAPEAYGPLEQRKRSWWRKFFGLEE